VGTDPSEGYPPAGLEVRNVNERPLVAQSAPESNENGAGSDLSHLSDGQRGG